MMKPSTTSWSLVATRSHFGSNLPPEGHSLPKCRFATSLKEGGYVKPELEILNLTNSDIITNSGTETTQVESNDGVWDLNQSI